MTTRRDPILQGLRILVTRPKEQAASLVTGIRALGGDAVELPCIEIVKPDDEQALLGEINQLPQRDMAIFISPSAVNMSLPLIEQIWPKFPGELQLAAVGAATRSSLENQGVQVHLQAAKPYNSEALLDLPELQQVAQKHITLFKGEGGRDLLRKVLTQRGACVYPAIAYKRECPDIDGAELLLSDKDHDIDLIVCTSVTILDNLCHIFRHADPAFLQQTTMLVMSRRIEKHFRLKGFTAPVLCAQDASVEAILEAIIAWRTMG